MFVWPGWPGQGLAPPLAMNNPGFPLARTGSSFCYRQPVASLLFRESPGGAGTADR